METEMETTPERVVEKTVHFPASRERVWMAITDPAELAMWFGDEAELDLRVGGDGAMTWENHGRYEMRVEEVHAPRRLVWSWVGEGGVAFDDAQTGYQGGEGVVGDGRPGGRDTAHQRRLTRVGKPDEAHVRQ